MGNKTSAEMFRSRIVGEGELRPSELLDNPRNWRKHPKAQLDALRGLLTEVGWVQRVIVNRTTGHIVDGHARVELARERKEPTVPVLYVALSPEEEALVLAALDPIGGMAETDSQALRNILEGLSPQDSGLASLIAYLGKSADLDEPTIEEAAAALSEYSVKIQPPTYTPKGDKPEVSALTKLTKYQQLVDEIQATPDLPEDVRAFLLMAAGRHIVFDYHQIAEFYCHASPQVQSLMEDSALVIIDVKKAIENGYIELSKHLASIYSEIPEDAEETDVEEA